MSDRPPLQPNNAWHRFVEAIAVTPLYTTGDRYSRDG